MKNTPVTGKHRVTGKALSHGVATFFALTLGLAFSLQASAGQKIYDYCFTSADPLNEQCNAYVAGFVEGAVITDSAIVDRLVPKVLSSNSLGYKNPPPTFYADFCLPNGASISEVSDQVVTKISAKYDSEDDISSAVYTAIMGLYPCAVGGS